MEDPETPQTPPFQDIPSSSPFIVLLPSMVPNPTTPPPNPSPTPETREPSSALCSLVSHQVLSLLPLTVSTVYLFFCSHITTALVQIIIILSFQSFSLQTVAGTAFQTHCSSYSLNENLFMSSHYLQGKVQTLGPPLPCPSLQPYVH